MSDPTTPDTGCTIAPYTGIKAGCYDNPTRICVNAKGQVTQIDTSESPSEVCCPPAVIGQKVNNNNILVPADPNPQLVAFNLTNVGVDIDPDATLQFYTDNGHVNTGTIALSAIAISGGATELQSVTAGLTIDSNDGNDFWTAFLVNPCGCKALYGTIQVTTE